MTNATPEIEWLYLLPTLIALGAGVIAMLVEAFVRDHELRRTVQVALTFVGSLGAFAAVVFLWNDIEGAGGSVFETTFVLDRQSLLWQGAIALFAILAVFLFAARTRGEDAFAALAAATPGSPDEATASRRGMLQTEVYPLALFAVGGMMLFTMVSDTLALFIVLEIFSLPLYILVALARKRRLMSQEAALKYFLMGAFSSAVYIFGAALMFGYSLSTNFSVIAATAASGGDNPELLFLGASLMIVGLLFKLGAVPFHGWTPDAYQGAPTPVTAFMAAATKAAAVAALIRLVYGALYGFEWELTPMLWTVAILTMVLGTVVALVQTDVKRMLAYSSIAHAGFILVALASFEGAVLSALPFYMLTYGLATIGAFAVVSQVREAGESGSLGAEATRLGQWAGLGKRSPVLGWAMALFLLSFAGIPLTAGFVAKFVAFAPAVEAGGWPLVLVAVLASAAAAFFYARLIVLMFLTPVPEDLEDAVVVAEERGPRGVIIVTAAATLLLGLAPAWLLNLAESGESLVGIF